MNALTQTLTERQAAFVRLVIQGTESKEAARMAGYSPEFLGEAVFRLKNQPHVQAAIHAGLRNFLQIEAAPAAIRFIFDVMGDPLVDKKLRVMCAKTLADRAGFIAPKAQETKAPGSRSDAELTADELKDRLDQIRRELSERATVVIEGDSAPVPDDLDSQALDILS